MTSKFKFGSVLVAAALALPAAAMAAPESYKIDPTHSFVEFSVPHLGFSLLQGRFNDVSGTFVYDEADPTKAAANVEVKTSSLDSNHAERDKHLRSDDFLNVDKYPNATFKSTRFVQTEDGGRLEGELTLHGVTKPIQVDVTNVGAGEDPWGGYRRGFVGRTTISRADWGVGNMAAPGEEMELEFFLEGIRQ